MKDRVLEILKSYNRALSFEEIDSALNINHIEISINMNPAKEPSVSCADIPINTRYIRQ